MTIEAAIRDLLINTTGVSSLVGSTSAARIYYLRLPEGAVLPAITYQRISRIGVPEYDGPSDLAGRRVQVDSWSTLGSQAATLAGEVRKAFDGFAGTRENTRVLGVFLLDEATGYETETELYRLRQDYLVWSHETPTT
jgi:hypothetical protein